MSPAEIRSLFTGKRMVSNPDWRSFSSVAVAGAVPEASRPSRSSDLAAISEREYEVLLLVAEGLTNRQIAQRLYIAEKTAKNHVSNLLGKLGVERRTQAAMLAARLHP